MLSGRYEATCRFFKSLKPPIPPPVEIDPHRRKFRHENLIDEVEMELHTLKAWELMFAGGLAGVVAWIVRISSLSFPAHLSPTSLYPNRAQDAFQSDQVLKC